MAENNDDEILLELPDVGLAAIRDGVVSNRTRICYVSEIFSFLLWLKRNEPQVLTTHGLDVMGSYIRESPNLSRDKLLAKYREQFGDELRHADENGIIVEGLITPELYMNYCRTLRNTRTRSYLSRSAYGVKRAALFHLFRLHNGSGYSEDFKLGLSNLFRGFFRAIVNRTSQRQLATAACKNEGEMDEITNGMARINTEEGKEPLSVALLKALCRWFLLLRETNDGVFAHCFLLMTWNLGCRVNNTVNIQFKDICWSHCFDCFHILFAHSKTDQTGDESHYPRHIFGNTSDPLVCPILSLAMYFSTCFSGKRVSESDFLFPGKQQENRFNKILNRVLEANKDAVRNFGYELHQIGSHSIRKGAASYLTSMPGGPSAAACCIRGGWSMGNVKDRYFKYAESGDQYVGRCLSLLPSLHVDLAVSPPYFGDDSDKEWVTNMVGIQFHALKGIGDFGLLLRMCLASMLHHYKWITDVLGFNHVVKTSSFCFKDAAQLKKVHDEKWIKVSYPWSAPHLNFSGIPPYCSILQHIAEIRSEQRGFYLSFVNRVKDALTEYGVNAGTLTEERVSAIMNEFYKKFDEQIARLEGGGGNRDNQGDQVSEREETFAGYKLHMYGGSFHRVPKDWRFPRCGLHDLWRQWWVGDSERNIPPLKMIEYKDVKHINLIALSSAEKERKVGPNKENRRKITKMLSDMRFLCNHMTKVVEQEGNLEQRITLGAVDRMFEVVVHRILPDQRDSQKQWLSVLRQIRRNNRRNATARMNNQTNH